MSVTRFFIPRWSPSCFLPLQGALQDQQVDLTRVPLNYSLCAGTWRMWDFVYTLRMQALPWFPLMSLIMEYLFHYSLDCSHWCLLCTCGRRGAQGFLSPPPWLHLKICNSSSFGEFSKAFMIVITKQNISIFLIFHQFILIKLKKLKLPWIGLKTKITDLINIKLGWQEQSVSLVY